VEERRKKRKRKRRRRRRRRKRKAEMKNILAVTGAEKATKVRNATNTSETKNLETSKQKSRP